jgi:hypothetical protein
VSAPDLLLRGFAWMSLLCWVAGEWARVVRGERPLLARVLFTAGLATMVAHSYLAFAFRYDFSFQAALVDAARQIEAVTGRPSSPNGFLTNYVFLAWWAGEATAWWLAPEGFARRPAWLVWLSRAFFAFMFVNGAIVFASGPVRVLGAAGVAAVVVAWARRDRGPVGAAVRS